MNNEILIVGSKDLQSKPFVLHLFSFIPYRKVLLKNGGSIVTKRLSSSPVITKTT